MKITVHTTTGLQEVEGVFVAGDFAVTKTLEWHEDPMEAFEVTHVPSGHKASGGPFLEEIARCFAVNIERVGIRFEDNVPVQSEENKDRYRHARDAALRGCFV